MEVRKNMAVNWDKHLSGFSESKLMQLSECEMDVEHQITFTNVTEIETSGHVVADVSSDTIEGDTLWLKGRFGFQNGCLSLLKAAGKKDIEGGTFTFKKIESEKSPTGYAFMWC